MRNMSLLMRLRRVRLLWAYLWGSQFVSLNDQDFAVGVLVPLLGMGMVVIGSRISAFLHQAGQALSARHKFLVPSFWHKIWVIIRYCDRFLYFEEMLRKQLNLLTFIFIACSESAYSRHDIYRFITCLYNFVVHLVY